MLQIFQLVSGDGIQTHDLLNNSLIPFLGPFLWWHKQIKQKSVLNCPANNNLKG